jgi:hypothetical protein
MPSRIACRAQLGALSMVCAAVLLVPLVLQTTATAVGPGRSGPATTVRTATSTFSFMYGASATVKVRGQKWVLSPSYSSGGLAIELYHHAGGYEYHTWTFTVPESSLARGRHDTWRLAPPSSSTAPVARVDVLFTATHHSAGVCKTGSETTYTGTLKGKVELTTGFKHVGQLGSKSMSFAHVSLLIDRSCTTKPVPAACATYTTADVIGSGNSYFYGSSSKAYSYLVVGNSETLSKPSGAYRYDEVDLIGASKRGSDSLQMSGKKGERVSGSITVTGKGSPAVSTYSCHISHKRHTETVSEWFTMSVKSSIVGHFELGPSLKIPGGTHSGSLDTAKFS